MTLDFAPCLRNVNWKILGTKDELMRECIIAVMLPTSLSAELIQYYINLTSSKQNLRIMQLPEESGN